ncbi:MAG: hypothetical protein IT443_03365 [Phycisphaeraceae bacterium]|nr:hypothetical protein [Phycisphaeraceae bacterium]
MATQLLAIYLWALGIYLLVKMVRQHRAQTHDLMSLRNIFLLGFIVFQLSSSAVSLFVEVYFKLTIRSPVWTGLQFSAMCTIFVIVFLWAYDRGWGVGKFANMIPVTRAEPGMFFMMALAIVFTAVGIALRFGVSVPLVALVTQEMGVGAAAVACGIAGWLWGRRLLNPFVLTFVVVVAGVNVMNSITGAFGRRGLVAVLVGVVWGMYYGYWRYLPLGQVVRRMVVLSVIPLMLVALFSSARTPLKIKRTAGEHIQAITSTGQLGQGIILLLRGQETGAAALWTIENAGRSFETRPLFTIWYFLVYPVPRGWWYQKPMPLAIWLPYYANVSGVPKGIYTMPPGIIGNAAAEAFSYYEGGWIVLVIYAVAFALFLRFFDQLIQNSVTSPFVVLPLGASLGQILGLARGEPSQFAFLYLVSVVAFWGLMLLLGKLLDYMGVSRAPDVGFDLSDDQQEPVQTPDESVEASAEESVKA